MSVSIPEWYLISEIDPKEFMQCIEPIYSVLEHRHKSKTSTDPFMKSILSGQNDLKESEWTILENMRLHQKALEMKLGDFHEELMGKFKGFETYPTGHTTKCDVGSLDGTIVIEVKNRHNTIKGSDGKHIVEMLKQHTKSGKTAILVQINCPKGKVNRFGADPSVKVMNGKEIYQFLSGRESFFEDLEKTMSYVFKKFKTFESLKSNLETL
jgi:hypothetical protein